MIPIKIQCGCGQRYAFDAEPVAGRLTIPVNCPACGTDGTAAANALLAEKLAALPPPGDASPKLHLSAPGATAPTSSVSHPANHLPASAPNASQLGLVDRQQAEVEARAKVSWGDPPESVLKYLMIQGFTHAEASALLAVMFKERAVQVRGVGIKKMITGGLMIAAGTGGVLYMVAIKIIITKLAGALVALALWGLWRVINGAIMVAAPRLQSGDVAEQ